MNLGQIKNEALVLSKSGKTTEDIVAFLKQRGCTKGVSVMLLPSILGCDFSKAKEMVRFSKAWEDQKETDEQLQRQFEESLSVVAIEKINDVIIHIIHLTKEFNELGNTTIHSLLKETGYFDVHNQISESAIREALILHPECVNNWIRFSEDKRSSAGWYFRQDGTNYEVGYFPPKQGKIDPTKYSDSAEACAAFIKHEIENIRGGAKN